MDSVSPATERFYTPSPEPDRDLSKSPSGDNLGSQSDDLLQSLSGGPFGSPLRLALLMLLPPEGIYNTFDELYKSI
jgi:hypothetical protein